MDDILIVEDDQALSQGIRLGLEGEGRRFVQASTLAHGERALEERVFSLVVLDLNLPDGSGLELDQVTGLELGADDYVTKPFSLAVLRARVNNLLRRAHSHSAVLELPPFTFDFQKMAYTRNGVPLERPERSSGCCACWRSTGGRPCPGRACWSRSGTAGNLWMRTPCRWL